MESTVLFRDRQELQSADLNNAQDFARASLDHVVRDAVEAGKGYVGFFATKTAATEVSPMHRASSRRRWAAKSR
jgi:hypothetical protein